MMPKGEATALLQGADVFEGTFMDCWGSISLYPPVFSANLDEVSLVFLHFLLNKKYPRPQRVSMQNEIPRSPMLTEFWFR
jgi:hypothetical protein